MEACRRGRWTMMLFSWSNGPSVPKYRIYVFNFSNIHEWSIKKNDLQWFIFRAIDAPENENDFVYISNEIYEEISKVITQKRKKIINHF